jgi:hypothetical protein
MNLPPEKLVGIQAVPVMVVEPKTCGLAIAAFVMGILSMFCSIFMAIPAILCGIIALVKIGKSDGRLKGNGFAVAGITVPAIVIFLITPILLAILIPAISAPKHISQRVVCGINLKGLSTAMMVYMNDYDDKCPSPEKWCDLLIQKVDVPLKSFKCPLDPEGSFSYAINENLYKIEPGQGSPKMVAFFEAGLGRNGVGGLDDVVQRHDRHESVGCIVTFADGHTAFIRAEEIPNLQWTVEE